MSSKKPKNLYVLTYHLKSTFITTSVYRLTYKTVRVFFWNKDVGLTSPQHLACLASCFSSCSLLHSALQSSYLGRHSSFHTPGKQSTLGHSSNLAGSSGRPGSSLSFSCVGSGCSEYLENGLRRWFKICVVPGEEPARAGTIWDPLYESLSPYPTVSTGRHAREL